MFSIDKHRKVRRRDDGGVEVIVVYGDDFGKFDITIEFTADEWCSLVTAVAKDADSAVVHDKVVKLHLGEEKGGGG